MSNITNVVQRVEGQKLILEIDLSQPGAPSKSGKTMLVGSTGGFASSPVAGVSVSLNVCRNKS